MATKTKRTKEREIVPPQEIRENTKARRAWLAEELAKVNATPGYEGKIVGQGSYQVVSVWKSVDVEGRLRYRGNCQICGRDQVVQDNTLVLHGYKRPGWDTVVNECPGQDELPLQISNALTIRYLKDAESNLLDAEQAYEDAEVAVEAARDALYSGDVTTTTEPYEAYPELPRMRYSVLPTTEQVTTLNEQRKAWAAKYPLRNAYRLAQNQFGMARQMRSNWQGAVQHFQALIDLNLPGTPLIEEVVT